VNLFKAANSHLYVFVRRICIENYLCEELTLLTADFDSILVVILLIMILAIVFRKFGQVITQGIS